MSDKRMRGSSNRKHVKIAIASVAALLVVVAVLVAVSASQESQDRRYRRIQSNQEVVAWHKYARLFGMDMVADDNKVMSWETPMLAEDEEDDFQRFEFVMELPEVGERERRVIYAAPRQANGVTSAQLAVFNDIIAARPEILDGTGLEAPLSLEELILNCEQVEVATTRLTGDERSRLLP